MRIKYQRFGGAFAPVERDIESVTLPNGGGKTTLLNAYLWVLTGRTLGGFQPVWGATLAPENKYGHDVITSVELDGFADFPTIRRTTTGRGTTLYVGGEVCTQADFAASCASRGIDLDFVAACCDANALTSDALTSEDLRRLLVRADVMDGGEVAALRKEAEAVRKAKKAAEQYALSNVVVPTRTVPDLNASELEMLRRLTVAKASMDRGKPKGTCAECGAPLDAQRVGQAIHEYNIAVKFFRGNAPEWMRLCEQRDHTEREKQAIADAQRLVQAATKARGDVAMHDRRLEEIDAQIRAIEATEVRAALPPGVTLVTEATAATTGTTKSVCTLEWEGVPLKSINRARRIEIAVRILDAARARKGLGWVPIWIDNAEAVQGLTDIDNVIRLTVG